MTFEMNFDNIACFSVCVWSMNLDDDSACALFGAKLSVCNHHLTAFGARTIVSNRIINPTSFSFKKKTIDFFCGDPKLRSNRNRIFMSVYGRFYHCGLPFWLGGKSET